MTKRDSTTAAWASIEDVAECGTRADALVSAALGDVMAQRRSAATALDYVKALSQDTPANCWDLAEAAGHKGPHRMQALLSGYQWSWDKLRGMLPALAGQCLLPDGDDDLIGPGIAIDETAHLKNGQSTACAAPQHAGCTGKVENCVTWVFAALVTVLGQTWADFTLYMPEELSEDPGGRRKAGIPEDLKFATKPAMAIEQVKRLAAAGLRFLWVAADEVYGRSGKFRETCRELGLAYVVIIPCDYKITIAAGTAARADEMINDVMFEQRSCGNGTKGPRYSGWALIATADPQEFLLIRRLPSREKNQYTFYLCRAPEGRPATMTYFITIAGRRWPVEVTFKTGKDTLGWDQSQVRGYDAMCRHTALTALAQIRAIAVRNALTGAITLPDLPAEDTGNADGDGDASVTDLQVYRGDAPLPARGGQPCPSRILPVGLSVAESSRLERLTGACNAGLLTRARLAFHYRWSAWRRRHQARARWHHYSTRLQALAT